MRWKHWRWSHFRVVRNMSNSHKLVLKRHKVGTKSPIVLYSLIDGFLDGICPVSHSMYSQTESTAPCLSQENLARSRFKALSPVSPAVLKQRMCFESFEPVKKPRNFWRPHFGSATHKLSTENVECCKMSRVAYPPPQKTSMIVSGGSCHVTIGIQIDELQ